MEPEITEFTIRKLKEIMDFENSLGHDIRINDLDHALHFALYYTFDARKRDEKERLRLQKELEDLKENLSQS